MHTGFDFRARRVDVLARVNRHTHVETTPGRNARRPVAALDPSDIQVERGRIRRDVLSRLVVVDGMDEAIEHIFAHSSGHTEAIITENYTLARRFLAEVDSSSVMVNASTRFADGFEYGLGAEIGISTDKIHTRGPVGLEGLTSQKYIVLGDGHIRG